MENKNPLEKHSMNNFSSACLANYKEEDVTPANPPNQENLIVNEEDEKLNTMIEELSRMRNAISEEDLKLAQAIDLRYHLVTIKKGNWTCVLADNDISNVPENLKILPLQDKLAELQAQYNLAEEKCKSGELQINDKPNYKDFAVVLVHNYLNHYIETFNDRKDTYLIKKEDIPEEYFKAQVELARQNGYKIEINQGLKDKAFEAINSDQINSLNEWTNYLSSSDIDYPNPIKYWIIRSITEMGEYNNEKKLFLNRREGTVQKFPELNREALAIIVDAMLNEYGKTQTQPPQSEQNNTYDNEFKRFLAAKDFRKMYSSEITKLSEENAEGLSNIQGKWIKYDRGSDPTELVESLKGRNTGWCTAGYGTAEIQLKGGDFYVYYSNDTNGNSNIPRIAIRMDGDRIGEIRGIAKNQNFDEYIYPVLETKLKEFPDAEKYKKKNEDMKHLTEIEHKIQYEELLDRNDLVFLYEINIEIEGFGYNEDPRIKEIISKRNIEEDLKIIFDCDSFNIEFLRFLYGIDCEFKGFINNEENYKINYLSQQFIENRDIEEDMKVMFGDINAEALKFLYEVRVFNFTHGESQQKRENKKIKKIIENRDLQEDAAILLNCEKSDVLRIIYEVDSKLDTEDLMTRYLIYIFNEVRNFEEDLSIIFNCDRSKLNYDALNYLYSHSIYSRYGISFTNINRNEKFIEKRDILEDVSILLNCEKSDVLRAIYSNCTVKNDSLIINAATMLYKSDVAKDLSIIFNCDSSNLNHDALSFLYGTVLSGSRRCSIIEQIHWNRDIKKDASVLLDCDESDVLLRVGITSFQKGKIIDYLNKLFA